MTSSTLTEQADGRRSSLGAARCWSGGSVIEYRPDGTPIRYWPDQTEVTPEQEALIDRIVTVARMATDTVMQRRKLT